MDSKISMKYDDQVKNNKQNGTVQNFQNIRFWPKIMKTATILKGGWQGVKKTFFQFFFAETTFLWPKEPFLTTGLINFEFICGLKINYTQPNSTVQLYCV